MKRLLSTLLVLTTASFAQPDKAFNAHDYGARGDGRTKDTAAIQKAIDACTQAGGGTVQLPAGTYLSGSIYLKDNVDFYLMAGATLLGSPDKEDYNPENVCPQNIGYRAESSFGAHLILTIEQKNVTVRGPGRIDGNSLAFIVDKSGKPHPGSQGGIPWRPSQMLYFVESQNIAVRDIELMNSPYWTCFFHGCTQVFVRGANVHNSRSPHTHNGDGFDVDCCQFVSISDCHINVADDCITLRADGERLKNPQPCKYITVANCTLSSPRNCVRIGVGDGQVSHAVFSNLVIHDARTAFNFFSSWSATSRGTDIDTIRFNTVSVECKDLIQIQYGYATETKIQNVYFSGISGTILGTSHLSGKPGLALKNIQLSDFSIEGPGDESFMEAADVDGLVLRDIRIQGKAPKIGLKNVTDLQVDNCKPEPQKMPDGEIKKP